MYGDFNKSTKLGKVIIVSDSKMQQRELWVDIAKAICIILMVIGHIGVPFVQYIYFIWQPFLFYRDIPILVKSIHGWIIVGKRL